ncbi:hypothetical protein NM208_g5538 [Fusarium decemcellulare]|uniref:Uncharacterized protein n=1 Tax=Fusarium decemcellulare TaxID=57161 RepID=A0ACC1SGQ3_9HYPO|nr:hypothetical protein NM208_g5538 [Fusarium decemcellulare]
MKSVAFVPFVENATRERSNVLVVIPAEIVSSSTVKLNAHIQNETGRSRLAKGGFPSSKSLGPCAERYNSYLEGILRENQQLRARNRGGQSEEPVQEVHPTADVDQDTQSPDELSENPLLDEKPWFHPLNSSSVPILIGEVADAAFATRFRQLLTSKTLGHIPRISYPGNDQITELANTECPRPGPTHARLLIRVALKSMDGSFHIVRNSSVWELLDKFLQAPQSLDSLSKCKLTALLALGELHSSRSQTLDTQIPGLAYFSQASRIYGLLEERPCIDAIEVSLLLCLYALCINRRHSAYFLASSAVRRGIVMGLHFNLPEVQLKDREVKEHLTRVWWTSYVLDHVSASISSQIVSVPDDEIFVDLPSSIAVIGARQTDFAHTEWILARIELAKISRKMIKSVYGRSRQKESFLQRVQHALRDLKQWVDCLPAEVQMDSQSSHSKPEAIRSLHLAFNQSVILATRPVLLHMLRMHQESNGDTPNTTEQAISSNVQTLAETCIRCARHSYSTIVECWIEGSFRTFDYFNTQFLFSAATVLAISSLVSGADSTKDREDFDFAGQLLAKLGDLGSFAAMEYCRHVEAMKADIQDRSWGSVQLPGQNEAESEVVSASDELGQLEAANQPGQFMTSGMALAEPSIEAFLQGEQSLAHVDVFLDNAQLEGLYWPVYDSL